MALVLKTGDLASSDITSQVTVFASATIAPSQDNEAVVTLYLEGLATSPGLIKISVRTRKSGTAAGAKSYFCKEKGGGANWWWTSPLFPLETATTLALYVQSNDPADTTVTGSYRVASITQASDVLAVAGATPVTFDSQLEDHISMGTIGRALWLCMKKIFR